MSPETSPRRGRPPPGERPRPGKPPPGQAPPRRFRIGSLQRRLLLAALACVAVALVAAGLAIGFILHRFVRGQIDGRLDDRILALAADLEVRPDGTLRLRRDLDTRPFDRSRSGWYWQVRRGEAVLRSGSLDGQDLVLPELPAAPKDRPDPERPRPADGTDPWGESLVLRIRALPTEGAPPLVIAASAPAAALRGPVLEALRALAASLAAIGLFLGGAAVLQVRLGLRPLRRLRDELAAVRAGRRARLPDEQPDEIRPLVTEMNLLLDQSAANLDHARTHVANLAHGLKTPLATLSVTLSDRAVDPDGTLARLVDGMDRRVRHHLRRARAAAVAGPARARTPLAGHLADLRAALLRIHAGKALSIDLAVPDGLAVACDAQDLDEMLGNLIENACQWCRTRVAVDARAMGTNVVIRIADDGPGLEPAGAEAVLRRGRRLDESVPGNGFGLPIALELAELYGGGLALGRAGLGGLEVRLTLPA